MKKKGILCFQLAPFPYLIGGCLVSRKYSLVAKFLHEEGNKAKADNKGCRNSMFPLPTLTRNPLLRNILTITMQQSRRSPAKRHPYRGKKAFATNATNASVSQQHAAPIPRVATPPLTEAVPLDSPRFADLGKENLLHPILLQTIIEDLKFDHMMPVQAATLPDLLAKRIDCLAQAKTGAG